MRRPARLADPCHRCAATAAGPTRRPRSPRLSRLGQAVLGLCLAGSGLHGGAPVFAQALPLPTGLSVRAGQAQLQAQGKQMTVRNSPNAILDWQRFDIGAANRVYFDQASAQSKVLNRVTGPEASAIFGQLGSNGQVWLLNPNGVLFGRDARVDVAGLVVSTLRLNDNDFLAGRYRFDAGGGAAATLRNEGQLRSSLGGQVALLAGRVENTGSIEAPGGSIAAVAAQSVELVDSGAPNLAVRLVVPAGEVLNLGELAAPGGRIDIHGATVNQQGLVRADSLQRDAQGELVLRASQALTLAAGSVTRAGGAAGGRVLLDAGEGALLVGGTLQADGTQAGGGTLTLQGRHVGLLDGARLHASGATGGGQVFVGGGLQGQDLGITNAQANYMAPGAVITADATTSGDGGRIVLWGNQATRAYGRFSARGGPAGGNGGFVETSGGWLDAQPAALDLGAPRGKPGLWLLDPNDIFISDGGPGNNRVTAGPVFTTTDDSANISAATLAAALNAGNSVTVATGAAGANSQAGDITMAFATLRVAPPNPVTLTLAAHRHVSISNADISSTTAPLNLVVRSAGNGSDGSVAITNSIFVTHNGSVRLGGDTPVSLPYPGSAVSTASLPFALGLSQFGVRLQQAQLALGTGDFLAYGSGRWEGVFIVSNSSVQARNVTVTGHGFAGIDPASGRSSHGFYLGSNSTLTASQNMRIEGGGESDGVLIQDGGRLVLDAAANPGGVLSITGRGVSSGVTINDGSGDAVAAYRPTPIRVTGGQLDLLGVNSSPGNDTGFGVIISPNSAFKPTLPSLDLSQASHARIRSQGSMTIIDVAIAGTGAGADLAFVNETVDGSAASGSGLLNVRRVTLTSAAGSNTSLEGVWVEVSLSTLNAGHLGIVTHPGAAGAESINITQSRADASADIFIGGANGGFPSVAMRGSQFTANDRITIQGGSASGNAVTIADSSVESRVSSLRVQGSTVGGQGSSVRLEGTTQLAGNSISVVGSGTISLRDGAGGRLQSWVGPLELIAVSAAGRATPSALTVVGGWRLDSPTNVSLVADEGIVLRAGATGAVPHITAGNSVELQMRTANGMVVGGPLATATLIVDDWPGTFGTMPPGSDINLFAAAPGAVLTVDGPVRVPVWLDLHADVLRIGPNGSLRTDAVGDALVMVGNTLVNQAGANALSTPNGRWGIVLANPLGTDLGGLSPAFTQYGMPLAAVNALPDDAAGNKQTALPGNVVYYAPTLASLLGNAAPLMAVSKPLDGNVEMPLDPARLPVGASLGPVSNLLPGNEVVIGGTALGRFDTPEVGANKRVLLAAGSTVAFLDAQGKPVLGYAPLALVGSIVAAAVPPVALPAAPPVAPPVVPPVAPKPAPSPAQRPPPAADSPLPPATEAVVLASHAQSQTATTGSLLTLTPVPTATRPSEGRALDATPALASQGGNLSFRPVRLSAMTRAEQEGLLAARNAFKKQLFGDALARLEQSPELAAVRPCKTAAELESGLCLITESLKQEVLQAREAAQWRQVGQRKVRSAAVPQIERKIALLVGINRYEDLRIPGLSSAVPDARSVRNLLAGALGYDTVLVEDASRAALLRALNRVALEAGPNDSVVIYYAGHGEVTPHTGMGYWLPADSRADDPATWLSNADIASLTARIGAKQVMLISDSCYAGTLAGTDAVGATLGPADAPQTLLARKAAVVLASGGNEPVADEGRDGHSIFAWHLMAQLGDVASWREGGRVFERVRDAVAREFPQTPQYGASKVAGHETGSDYLFERRDFEPGVPATR